jgi:hypothetical protein
MECVECKASFAQEEGEMRRDELTKEIGFVCWECITTTPIPDHPMRVNKKFRSFNLDTELI